jgi:hypothetical protein
MRPKEYYKNIGKLRKYWKPKTSRKGRKQTYKDILIIRNNIEKIIKNNQYPAYKKVGWVKLVGIAGVEPSITHL